MISVRIGNAAGELLAAWKTGRMEDALRLARRDLEAQGEGFAVLLGDGDRRGLAVVNGDVVETDGFHDLRPFRSF